jgi:hypothetical protein
VNEGDLIRIKEAGAFGIVIDPYSEDQPINGYVCKVLTPNTGYFYLYWNELERIGEKRITR